jgi:hypothetical protein
MALLHPTEEEGRSVISDVVRIINDPTTISHVSNNIEYDVIIAVNGAIGSSYTIATHVRDNTYPYPLKDECDIHRSQDDMCIRHPSPDGIRWVICDSQSFHDPITTNYPHIFVDGIHVIFVNIPIITVLRVEDEERDNDYGTDDDGSSWGEGSVVSEGDFSEADTESVVSENGDDDNGCESIDEIQENLPAITVAYVHQTMNIDLLMRYVELIRAYSEKKRWIRWYVFFANGNRLHTNNNELLHIARILKFAVWTCSQHSGIFEGMSYDDCVKLIVNAICEN